MRPIAKRCQNFSQLLAATTHNGHHRFIGFKALFALSQKRANNIGQTFEHIEADNARAAGVKPGSSIQPSGQLAGGGGGQAGGR